MIKPYIQNLMLGTSVKELASYILNQQECIHGRYDDFFDKNLKKYRSYSPEEWWEKLIKLLVKSKDKNIRFIEDTPDLEYPNSIEVFAPKLEDEWAAGELPLIQYDSDNCHWAEDDVEFLNDFIKDFYGTKSKPVKAKITSEEYASKKQCPVCKKKKGIRQQGHIWIEEGQAHRHLGCDLCNSIWIEHFVLSGFYDLDVR